MEFEFGLKECWGLARGKEKNRESIGQKWEIINKCTYFCLENSKDRNGRVKWSQNVEWSLYLSSYLISMGCHTD